MKQLMFTDVETQLSKEHNLKYQRTAKVSLNQIFFHPSECHQLYQKNVEQLCRIFSKSGCQQLDHCNHISAVVSKQNLEDALRAAQVESSLVDEYSNKQLPSDGEVYQKVRQYEYEANTCHKDCWITCLSENKAKCLQQLLHHDHIWAGFDSLLVIPELWSRMNIGSLHQVITLNCDEEVIHYLEYVKKFWFSLVEGNLSKMMKINLHTVEALELLAPGVSHKDAKTMQGLVLRGEAFSNFDSSEHMAIWKKLQRTKAIIPSLFTFFQDIGYLEGMAAAEHSNLEYHQLCLYASQHSAEMPPVSKKNNLLMKPSYDSNETMIYEMAALAQQLNFDSTPIKELIEQSPDQQIARAAALKAWRPDCY
ncbi:hypothetical protein CIHG_09956 [Coccidioides immitis H538.4]|uniref:Uncharacterized protein n=1 Tax=Coccidioides immitis H538.4 TaxID=396776 RepID=A0A0J8S5P2_COCIT|nr:hypothetical protein CIHG_09956 [Coccidioides immitis H538.4]